MRVLKFVLFAVIAVTVLGAAVMVLWNWLVPPIVGWQAVTFWQALGLLVLSRILFGRIGGPGRRPDWRRRMKARWSQMTVEERERFMAAMKGGAHHPRATDPPT